MPAGTKSITIDSYRVDHMFVNVKGDGAVNMITCYSGGKYVGDMRFYQQCPFPVSKMSKFQDGSLTFQLNHEISRYSDVIETIRYEKPIYVWVEWDANNVITLGELNTAMFEPVGEQEGA